MERDVPHSNLSFVPIWEPLEGRILFDGFSASINFQPAKTPVPAGYLADSGEIYGDRGNGYTYGWNGKLPALTRQQNAAKKANNGPRCERLRHLRPALSHGSG